MHALPMKSSCELNLQSLVPAEIVSARPISVEPVSHIPVLLSSAWTVTVPHCRNRQPDSYAPRFSVFEPILFRQASLLEVVHYCALLVSKPTILLSGGDIQRADVHSSIGKSVGN